MDLRGRAQLVLCAPNPPSRLRDCTHPIAPLRPQTITTTSEAYRNPGPSGDQDVDRDVGLISLKADARVLLVPTWR
jgi:hypothetical protein